MANIIEPTPILSGGDAKRFLELTVKAEKEFDQKMSDFLKECFLLYSKHRF